MPTYGLSTAKKHPVIRVLKKIEQKIAKLQNERDAIMSACDHHFIPEKDALEKLGPTKISGVYHARSVGEVSGMSEVIFLLVCTCCGLSEIASISERCPICAAKTRGEWESSDDLEKFFEGTDFDYNGLWLISCTHCDFKAAGLRWDQ